MLSSMFICIGIISVHLVVIINCIINPTKSKTNIGHESFSYKKCLFTQFCQVMTIKDQNLQHFSPVAPDLADLEHVLCKVMPWSGKPYKQAWVQTCQLGIFSCGHIMFVVQVGFYIWDAYNVYIFSFKMQLYTSTCWPVCLSVGWSVGLSVGWSVRRVFSLLND